MMFGGKSYGCEAMTSNAATTTEPKRCQAEGCENLLTGKQREFCCVTCGGRTWYAAHREHVSARCKRRRKAHPEEARAPGMRYYEAHREESLVRGKRYREAHRDETRATKKRYRETHREGCRGRDKRYREAHPERLRARNKRNDDIRKVHRRLDGKSPRCRLIGEWHLCKLQAPGCAMWTYRRPSDCVRKKVTGLFFCSACWLEHRVECCNIVQVTLKTKEKTNGRQATS